MKSTGGLWWRKGHHRLSSCWWIVQCKCILKNKKNKKALASKLTNKSPHEILNQKCKLPLQCRGQQSVWYQSQFKRRHFNPLWNTIITKNQQGNPKKEQANQSRRSILPFHNANLHFSLLLSLTSSFKEPGHWWRNVCQATDTFCVAINFVERKGVGDSLFPILVQISDSRTPYNFSHKFSCRQLQHLLCC